MKISPLASGAGTPGQVLGNVEIGRTASPQKLARAKQIASGQVVEEQPQQEIALQPNTKSIKMNTQRSVYRNPQEQAEQEIQPEEATESTVSPINEAAVEDTKPLSPQFAALAKQRRALQLERAQIDKDKAALEAQKASPGTNELIERLKSQPLSVLQENGISYDQLTEAVLEAQNGSSEQLRAIEKQISSFKEEIDKRFNDRDLQAEQAALDEMSKEAVKLAKEGDEFALIRETKSVSKVMDLIKRTWQEQQEILDVTEAMQLVEDELVNESLKLAKLGKVQGKLNPAPTIPAQSAQQPTMRTLTNRNSATTPASRKERAMAAFNGTLKR